MIKGLGIYGSIWAKITPVRRMCFALLKRTENYSVNRRLWLSAEKKLGHDAATYNVGNTWHQIKLPVSLVMLGFILTFGIRAEKNLLNRAEKEDPTLDNSVFN